MCGAVPLDRSRRPRRLLLAASDRPDQGVRCGRGRPPHPGSRGHTGGLSKTSTLALLCLAGAFYCSAQPAGARYDLGGPCRDASGAGTFLKILEAKKSGAWDRVVDLSKLNVRESCGNEYRWYELVSALLYARRQPEAVQALQEMDARGFDLNPSLLGGSHPDVRKFMGTPIFMASPAGRRIEALKKVADERHAVFREALSRFTPAQKPPDNYVAKGVCPFECCRYGNWTAIHDTDLVAAPESARIVGRARKGSRVVSLTGEVHLKPEPVLVRMDGELPKDSIAFVLDRGGEGYGHVYSRGKVVEIFIGVARYCFRVSESCWGETLAPAGEPHKQVWWVKLKLPNGVIGWTDKAVNFAGKDSCS